MAEDSDRKGAWPAHDSLQLKCIELLNKAGHEQPVDGRLEITINFHPDRLTSAGVPLLKAIADDGVVKSQFETGTSNGGLTAFPGGGRWLWESRAFNGIYDDCEPSIRPKYGALNYKKLGSGGSPRFGSSYFKLKPNLLERTTFCYPESFFGPVGYGAGHRVGHLITLANADDRDLLDNYVEAHVHGSIDIGRDIEALVLDPSYRGTDVEALAIGMPFDIEWHAGFRLAAKTMELHPDYRGLEIVRIGRAIAIEGWLTPRIIGQAVNEAGAEAQGLKKVWHYLARFGDLNQPEPVSTVSGVAKGS